MLSAWFASFIEATNEVATIPVVRDSTGPLIGAEACYTELAADSLTMEVWAIRDCIRLSLDHAY